MDFIIVKIFEKEQRRLTAQHFKDLLVRHCSTFEQLSNNTILAQCLAEYINSCHKNQYLEELKFLNILVVDKDIEKCIEGIDRFMQRAQ